MHRNRRNTGGMEQKLKLSGFISKRTRRSKIFPRLHGSVRNIYAKSGNSISLKMENNDKLLGLKYLVSI